MIDPVSESKRRIVLYEKTGVDGLFLPCITKLNDIKEIISTTKLPLNVMCMPDLPGFDALKAEGVKRISMGNFLNKTVYQKLESQTKRILEDQNFSSLFVS